MSRQLITTYEITALSCRARGGNRRDRGVCSRDRSRRHRLADAARRGKNAANLLRKVHVGVRGGGLNGALEVASAAAAAANVCVAHTSVELVTERHTIGKGRCA